MGNGAGAGGAAEDVGVGVGCDGVDDEPLDISSQVSLCQARKSSHFHPVPMYWDQKVVVHP